MKPIDYILRGIKEFLGIAKPVDYGSDWDIVEEAMKEGFLNLEEQVALDNLKKKFSEMELAIEKLTEENKRLKQDIMRFKQLLELLDEND